MWIVHNFNTPLKLSLLGFTRLSGFTPSSMKLFQIPRIPLESDRNSQSIFGTLENSWELRSTSQILRIPMMTRMLIFGTLTKPFRTSNEAVKTSPDSINLHRPLRTQPEPLQTQSGLWLLLTPSFQDHINLIRSELLWVQSEFSEVADFCLEKKLITFKTVHGSLVKA